MPREYLSNLVRCGTIPAGVRTAKSVTRIADDDATLAAAAWRHDASRRRAAPHGVFSTICPCILPSAMLGFLEEAKLDLLQSTGKIEESG